MFFFKPLTSVKVGRVLFYSTQLTMLRFISAENKIEQVKKWQAICGDTEEREPWWGFEHFL